ncbi:hypothetical protein DDE74_31730 [Streptomyces lydicus]|uniref:Tn3 transposase DDE domain-containing protein n=1 Tax=Streptomyces lydicus TaxID=47763 RepID=A0A3Q9KDP0_9ACTN|nr:hypothetical protein DDE74_31730 [Streptomyces lydicus]
MRARAHLCDIDAAVAQLKAEGHEIADEDIARLSPLKHRNLNVLGRFELEIAAHLDITMPHRARPPRRPGCRNRCRTTGTGPYGDVAHRGRRKFQPLVPRSSS